MSILSPTRPDAKQHVTFRISVQDLQQINELAQSHQLTRTQYVIDAACNRLEDRTTPLEERVKHLEAEMRRLTELAY